jgi:importin subunit beta-1
VSLQKILILPLFLCGMFLLIFYLLKYFIYLFIYRDDLVMKTAVGVLGDLADTLGSNAGSLIQQSLSSKEFLNECLSSDDHLIKESAEWARLAISRAISV